MRGKLGEVRKQQVQIRYSESYFEDAAIVYVMVFVYKVWIELWENYLVGKQVLWLERQEGDLENYRLFLEVKLF